jgi:hypothetical protein
MPSRPGGTRHPPRVAVQLRLPGVKRTAPRADEPPSLCLSPSFPLDAGDAGPRAVAPHTKKGHQVCRAKGCCSETADRANGLPSRRPTTTRYRGPVPRASQLQGSIRAQDTSVPPASQLLRLDPRFRVAARMARSVERSDISRRGCRMVQSARERFPTPAMVTPVESNPLSEVRIMRLIPCPSDGHPSGVQPAEGGANNT